MACEWGCSDCVFEGKRCDECYTDKQHYKPIVIKERKGLSARQQKADKRTGSSFEASNHKRNVAMLEGKTTTHMTLNSGATTLEKGDEQILGDIRIMEEYKTQVGKSARGATQFTIQRKWLDKLHAEAKAESMEYMVLKFSFSEDEAVHQGGGIFAVMEDQQYMSMVATMLADRKKAKTCQAKIDVAERRKDVVEAENVLLKAKISLLEAELKLKGNDVS